MLTKVMNTALVVGIAVVALATAAIIGRDMAWLSQKQSAHLDERRAPIRYGPQERQLRQHGVDVQDLSMPAIEKAQSMRLWWSRFSCPLQLQRHPPTRLTTPIGRCASSFSQDYQRVQ